LLKITSWIAAEGSILHHSTPRYVKGSSNSKWSSLGRPHRRGELDGLFYELVTKIRKKRQQLGGGKMACRAKHFVVGFSIFAGLLLHIFDAKRAKGQGIHWFSKLAPRDNFINAAKFRRETVWMK